MTAEQYPLIWSSDIIRVADGSVRIVPTKPLIHMTAKQAGRVLGCEVSTIWRLYRLGLLRGSKPGAVVVRRDGRRSNARLRLETDSVLEYKRRQESAALDEKTKYLR